MKATFPIVVLSISLIIVDARTSGTIELIVLYKSKLFIKYDATKEIMAIIGIIDIRI